MFCTRRVNGLAAVARGDCVGGQRRQQQRRQLRRRHAPAPAPRPYRQQAAVSARPAQGNHVPAALCHRVRAFVAR